MSYPGSYKLWILSQYVSVVNPSVLRHPDSCMWGPFDDSFSCVRYSTYCFFISLFFKFFNARFVVFSCFRPCLVVGDSAEFQILNLPSVYVIRSLPIYDFFPLKLMMEFSIRHISFYLLIVWIWGLISGLNCLNTKNILRHPKHRSMTIKMLSIDRASSV